MNDTEIGFTGSELISLVYFQNSIWPFWKPRVNRKPCGTTTRIWQWTAIPTLALSRHNLTFNDGGKSVIFFALRSLLGRASLGRSIYRGICIRKPLRMSKHFIEKWLESGFRCRLSWTDQQSSPPQAILRWSLKVLNFLYFGLFPFLLLERRYIPSSFPDGFLIAAWAIS